MDTDEIRKTVREVIASIVPDADLQGIRTDLPLRRQIELDSMDWLNVIVGLHERLATEIPESDYAQLGTEDAIVAYVTAHRGTQASARRALASGFESQAQSDAATRAAAAAPPTTTHFIGGRAVTVRPIRPDDLQREVEFVRDLSEDSRYERFMVTVRQLSPAKLDLLTHVDQIHDVALAATVIDAGGETLVGVARYGVDASGTSGEFAIAVADAWHGTGLAGILMHELMDVARGRGLLTMEGIVLATNSRMLKLARQLGFRQLRDAQCRDTVRIVRAL